MIAMKHKTIDFNAMEQLYFMTPVPGGWLHNKDLNLAWNIISVSATYAM